MRTVRKLSFFGILAVIVAVLFLVGISFVEAQVKIQEKPDKPGKPDKLCNEKATWAVQIPAGSVHLLGTQAEYVNNGNDIIVNVEKKGWKTVGKGGASGIYYIFIFKLVNPTNEYVVFNGVNLTLNNINPDERICAFPEICDSDVPYPYCMQCFLNQNHPYSSDSVEYDHIYIKFWIWGYDIEAMSPGYTYQLGLADFTSSNDRIRIKTGYTPVNTCFREEPYYHNILCQKYAEDAENGLLNIWIERDQQDQNKWRIYVGKYDEGPASLPVKETYCIEEKQKGWVSKTVTTLEATGDFYFIMDWIKKSK